MSRPVPRVLLLEPYYGGSHRQWLDGIRQHLHADYRLFTLPARKWKQRLQLAAPWFVEELRRLPIAERAFDLLLCSSLLDVAVLRALLASLPGWSPATRIHTYFHENQFVYPGRRPDPGRFQFCASNWYSALASDRLAFNSRYNAETFVAGCRQVLRQARETPLLPLLDRLATRCQVLYPAVDFRAIDSLPERREVTVPVLVWNHRWEHDKDPETFCRALLALLAAGLDFHLILLGRPPAGHCPWLSALREALGSRIRHCGYAPTRAEYAWWLRQGDIVVSTARHEFFGLAVAEAVRAGCRPVLPAALAYPELYPAEYLYRPGEAGELERHLAMAISDRRRLTAATAVAMTEACSWPSQEVAYRQWLGLATVASPEAETGGASPSPEGNVCP